eukprot:g10162.t1
MRRKALSARTVARALRRCDAVEAEPGRFYALLSLGEAEGVRALMHRRPLSETPSGVEEGERKVVSLFRWLPP